MGNIDEISTLAEIRLKLNRGGSTNHPWLGLASELDTRHVQKPVYAVSEHWWTRRASLWDCEVEVFVRVSPTRFSRKTLANVFCQFFLQSRPKPDSPRREPCEALLYCESISQPQVTVWVKNTVLDCLLQSTIYTIKGVISLPAPRCWATTTTTTTPPPPFQTLS